MFVKHKQTHDTHTHRERYKKLMIVASSNKDNKLFWKAFYMIIDSKFHVVIVLGWGCPVHVVNVLLYDDAKYAKKWRR